MLIPFLQDEKSKKFLKTDFSGGMSRRGDPIKTQDNQYPLLRNGRVRYENVKPTFEPRELVDELPGKGEVIYGLDFGYTNDPTAMVQVFETPDAYYYDEIIYRTGLTNPEISAAMKDSGISRYDDIIADSAEPKSIEELHRMGWNIKPCVKGADSVRHGITTMRSKKQYLTPRSSNLQREFSSYSWKQDKNGRWLDAPIDMFNHGIDAIRYRVDSRGRIVRAGTAASALGL